MCVASTASRRPACPVRSSQPDDFDAILPAFAEPTPWSHLAADPRTRPTSGGHAASGQRRGDGQRVQAARRGGVKRFVFFSSMHVCGLYETDPPWSRSRPGLRGLDPSGVPLVTADMPVRPTGPYAVSKIFGESLGRYYADAYGMEVVVVRLGTVGREDKPAATRAAGVVAEPPGPRASHGARHRRDRRHLRGRLRRLQQHVEDLRHASRELGGCATRRGTTPSISASHGRVEPACRAKELTAMAPLEVHDPGLHDLVAPDAPIDRIAAARVRRRQLWHSHPLLFSSIPTARRTSKSPLQRAQS